MLYELSSVELIEVVYVIEMIYLGLLIYFGSLLKFLASPPPLIYFVVRIAHLLLLTISENLA